MSILSSQSKAKTSYGKVSSPVLALIIGCVVIFTVIFATKIDSFVVGNWEETTATIIEEPDHITPPLAGLNTLAIDIYYEYSYQGKEYQGMLRDRSTSGGITPESRTRSILEEDTDAIAGGKTFTVLVNPNNPSESVVPSRVSPRARFIVVAAMFLAVVGLIKAASYLSNNKTDHSKSK